MTATRPIVPSAADESAVNRIKAEHRALARVLGAMQALVARYREPATSPDYELFGSMLRYIENVPDRLHHPKEDQVLFSAVARRADRGKELVRTLESEHAQGAAMLSELRRAFNAFRDGGANAINQLASAIDEFVEFYWSHMRKEEQLLLPLAAEVLTEEDWQRIDSAFGDNADPLFGSELAAEYRRLYERIAELSPSPLKSLFDDGTTAS